MDDFPDVYLRVEYVADGKEDNYWINTKDRYRMDDISSGWFFEKILPYLGNTTDGKVSFIYFAMMEISL